MDVVVHVCMYVCMHACTYLHAGLHSTSRDTAISSLNSARSAEDHMMGHGVVLSDDDGDFDTRHSDLEE